MATVELGHEEDDACESTETSSQIELLLVLVPLEAYALPGKSPPAGLSDQETKSELRPGPLAATGLSVPSRAPKKNCERWHLSSASTLHVENAQRRHPTHSDDVEAGLVLDERRRETGRAEADGEESEPDRARTFQNEVRRN